MNHFFRVILIITISSFCALTSKSQSAYQQLPANSNSHFGIQFMRPLYKGLESQKLYSGVYELFYSQAVSSNWRLNFSMPISKFSATYSISTFNFKPIQPTYVDSYMYNYVFNDAGDPVFINTIESSAQGVGNLSLGASYIKESSNRYNKYLFELSIPTATRGNIAVINHMYFTDIINFHKYSNNVTTLSSKYLFGNKVDKGWNYFTSIGMQFCFTGKAADINDDLYLNYGIGGGYKTKSIAAAIEVIGIGNLTGDSSDFDNIPDRTLNMASFGIHWVKGRFKPSLFYSHYLKDALNDRTSGTLGFKVAYNLAKK